MDKIMKSALLLLFVVSGLLILGSCGPSTDAVTAASEQTLKETQAKDVVMEKITKLIANGEVLVLATAGADGAPYISQMHFGEDTGNIVYCRTSVNSEKINDIKENPRVAYTLSNSTGSFSIQVIGTAKLLTRTEMEEKKDKFSRTAKKEIDDTSAVIAITPIKAVVIDHSVNRFLQQVVTF